MVAKDTPARPGPAMPGAAGPPQEQEQTMSDSQQPQQEHRLREGYERMLERLREGAQELTWENLQKELDEAVAFEAALAEFTRAELSLLRAWVERDVKDRRRYPTAGGESVATWLGSDRPGLSRKVSEPV